MKVLNLQCGAGHGFEGWFASEDDFQSQLQRELLTCPMCGSAQVRKLPSAPRLNLGATEPPAPQAAKPVTNRPQDLQAAWLQTVREMLERTEDVGERFAEEARRIHYGEAQERGIRGQATPDQTQALLEEGIEVMSLPVPAALKGPLQ